MNKAMKYVMLSAGAYGCYQVGKIVGAIKTNDYWIKMLFNKN